MEGEGERYGSLQSIHIHWRLMKLLGVRSLYAILEALRFWKQPVL